MTPIRTNHPDVVSINRLKRRTNHCNVESTIATSPFNSRNIASAIARPPTSRRGTTHIDVALVYTYCYCCCTATLKFSVPPPSPSFPPGKSEATQTTKNGPGDPDPTLLILLLQDTVNCTELYRSFKWFEAGYLGRRSILV